MKPRELFATRFPSAKSESSPGGKRHEISRYNACRCRSTKKHDNGPLTPDNRPSYNACRCGSYENTGSAIEAHPRRWCFLLKSAVDGKQVMTRETSEAANGAQPQVFISYGGADAERVLKIVRLLEAEGITVWHHGDRILGGQLWDEEIVHAIDHSRVVMLMCSPHSFQSDNVRREVLLTWEYAHRRYVPVWISPPMEIPLRFRFCLAGCQWIDAHSQPQEQWLPQLLKAFQAQGIDTKNKLVRAVEPTPAPGPGTSEHFGATRGFRRWVAVGADWARRGRVRGDPLFRHRQRHRQCPE